MKSVYLAGNDHTSGQYNLESKSGQMDDQTNGEKMGAAQILPEESG